MRVNKSFYNTFSLLTSVALLILTGCTGPLITTNVEIHSVGSPTTTIPITSQEASRRSEKPVSGPAATSVPSKTSSSAAQTRVVRVPQPCPDNKDCSEAIRKAIANFVRTNNLCPRYTYKPFDEVPPPPKKEDIMVLENITETDILKIQREYGAVLIRYINNYQTAVTNSRVVYEQRCEEFLRTLK